MTGFVLAAGFGTRLKPITDRIPKALVPVCGIPLLERAINFMHKAGCAAIGVNSHHLHDQMEAWCARSSMPVSLFHEADRIRGTGGALWFARDFLARNDLFIVCNADIIAILDLAELVRRFAQSEDLCALAAVPADRDGSIAYEPKTGAFIDACANNAVPEGAAQALFYGVAIYRREFLEQLTADDFSIVPVWKRARQNGLSIRVYETPGVYWKDTGSPSALAQIHFDRLDGRAHLPVAPDMIVDRDRAIAAPSSVGQDRLDWFGRYVWCDIGDVPEQCSISHSIIMPGSVMARNTIVTNTLLSPWGICAL